MKKLNKQQISDAQQLIADLASVSDDVDKAIDRYNEAMADAREELEKTVSDYNDELAKLRDFRDEIVSDMDEYIDARSEKWHDTDAGQNYAAWKEQWESLEADDIEIDWPEDIETPDMEPNALEEISWEVEA